jgi:uncharacterized membrane protein
MVILGLLVMLGFAGLLVFGLVWLVGRNPRAGRTALWSGFLGLAAAFVEMYRPA